MPISSSTSSSRSWKNYFLKSNTISYSNSVLSKIRNSVDLSKPFTSSVREISKNPGILFLSLDASKEKIQLFHHVSVIGGSWTEEKEKLVGILGYGSDIIPIQIMQNSIKEVKGKSFTFDQIAERLRYKDPLEHDRTAKSSLHHFNILPIPALVTHVFLGLEETDPFNVATAFVQAMYQFDSEGFFEDENQDNQEKVAIDKDEDEQSSPSAENRNNEEEKSMEMKLDRNANKILQNSFVEEFAHILQFCRLCHRKVVTPILYTLLNVPSSDSWLSSVYSSLGCNVFVLKKSKRGYLENSPSNQEEMQLYKISRTDEHLINTMLKIHESFDNNITQSNKEKEEKEPGFKPLEPHKKKPHTKCISITSI